MEATQYYPPVEMPNLKRACFVPHERTNACPFDALEGLVAADAEEGGLAKLFTVRLGDGQIIAVKRFHGTRELDEPLFEQHQRVAEDEYLRMAKLDGADGHAPLAYALGSCFDDKGCEHPAIAMQFIDGFTLEYALKKGLLTGSARKADKSRCILQTGLHISRALKACEVVSHRDLNPRNVMVIMDRWGNVQRAVLIDFGQSVATANPLVTPAIEPHRLATVSFGAPEMYGGPFYFMRNNTSVDVYSFGALLYYLRTRSIPFLEESALDATTREGALKIVEAKGTPVDIAAKLGSSLRDIDMHLHQLAQDCTAFDPRDRPSIDAVIVRLERALGAGANAAAAGASAHSARPSAQVDLPHEPAALMQLADDYFYGHGGKSRSKQLSYQCLVRAAESGEVAAQFKLGRSLALGQHGIVDAQKARHWLNSAATLGHPGAATTLRALT